VRIRTPTVYVVAGPMPSGGWGEVMIYDDEITSGHSEFTKFLSTVPHFLIDKAASFFGIHN